MKYEVIQTISYRNHFSGALKMYVHFIMFMLIYRPCKVFIDILSIDCIEFEFFWVTLHMNYHVDFRKKFQVASLHDVGLWYQIRISCYYLFLSYASNTHTHTHTHRDHSVEMRFSDSGNIKTCNFNRNSVSKIRSQNNIFSTTYR